MLQRFRQILDWTIRRLLVRVERVEEVVGGHNVSHHGVQIVPVEHDDRWSVLEAHHYPGVAPSQRSILSG